ncbi:uncharacterized protein YukE [Psychromicrobium silvestre]|uniref:Uncharacterized protein YukE n=1 Tax=Psychromicrobium silvestre TaxID=1645614 RepID=A0A7Y9LVR4_9MICC|nr:hypothetical protein [Psychromicrobium silvestre]NYE96505.1 uncharacterized protein YukE [Psychromicrobium silvestre]
MQAFTAAAKALVAAGSKVQDTKPLRDGDLGTSNLEHQIVVLAPSWSKGTAAFIAALTSAGKQVAHAGTEFIQVDKALAGKFGNQ